MAHVVLVQSAIRPLKGVCADLRLRLRDNLRHYTSANPYSFEGTIENAFKHQSRRPGRFTFSDSFRATSAFSALS